MKTVEFNVEACQEYTEVRGNAMCSGDDDYDRKVEDRILANLDDGNVWTWASIRVSASIDGIECADYLGCCSYKDEEDFLKDVYYLDMKCEALSNLRAKYEDSMRAIERAEEELASERATYDKRISQIELWRCPHCKDVIAVDPGYDDTPFCADCDTERDSFKSIDVVFLRDTIGGDVFAVFPGESATVGNLDHMIYYSHINRHSITGTTYCKYCEEVTDPAEYADLFAELTCINYDIHVIRKNCMNDAKYLDARREQLQE